MLRTPYELGMKHYTSRSKIEDLPSSSDMSLMFRIEAYRPIYCLFFGHKPISSAKRCKGGHPKVITILTTIGAWEGTVFVTTAPQVRLHGLSVGQERKHEA